MLSVGHAMPCLRQADDDGSTLLHKQLPQKLQDVVLDEMVDFGKHPRIVEGLLKVAVDAQREQQQEIEGLREQVAQVQQHATKMQQHAAEMQAALQQQQQESTRLQVQLQAGAAQQELLEQRLNELQASLGWRQC
jgi:septal ring factor EnvC (AmiA/AmiB activator)